VFEQVRGHVEPLPRRLRPVLAESPEWQSATAFQRPVWFSQRRASLAAARRRAAFRPILHSTAVQRRSPWRRRIRMSQRLAQVALRVSSAVA